MMGKRKRKQPITEMTPSPKRLKSDVNSQSKKQKQKHGRPHLKNKWKAKGLHKDSVELKQTNKDAEEKGRFEESYKGRYSATSKVVFKSTLQRQFKKTESTAEVVAKQTVVGKEVHNLNRQKHSSVHLEKESNLVTNKSTVECTKGERKKKSKKLWKKKKGKQDTERKDNECVTEEVKLLNKSRSSTDCALEPQKNLPPKAPAEFSSNWKKLMQNGSLDFSGSQYSMQEQTLPKRKKKALHGTNHCKSSSSEKKQKPSDQEVWFDDVDDILLEDKTTSPVVDKDEVEKALVKDDSFKGLTRTVAMDCEMVGVGSAGKDSILARVSIVNQYGHPIYDKFVQPTETVVDYRTSVSGVRPKDLENGEEFCVVQKEVNNIINGRLLVGHAITNDLKVLYLDHPRKMIRDTSRYKPFRTLLGGRRPGLKKLSEKVLKVKVQEGEHNSIEDAQAAMRLYTMHKKQWEKDIKENKISKMPKIKKKAKK